MTAIITEKFRLHNATQFFESFSEAAANKYYMLIGKQHHSLRQPVVAQTPLHQLLLMMCPVSFMFGIKQSQGRIYHRPISRMFFLVEIGLTPQHLICMMIRLVHQTQQHLEQQTFMTQPFSSELQIIEYTRF